MTEPPIKGHDRQTRQLDLKKHVEVALNELRTLRDEIRVQAHLFDMEAKRRWSELEPHLHRAEESAMQASEVAAAVLGGALQALLDFQASTQKKR